METGDIFIHRGGPPPRRNRTVRAIGLLLVLLAAAAAVMLIRRSRGGGESSPPPTPPANPAAVLTPPAPASLPAAPAAVPPPTPAPPTPTPPAPAAAPVQAPEAPKPVVGAPAPAPAPATPPAAADGGPASPAALAAWAEASDAASRGDWGVAREKAMTALAAKPPAALQRQIEDALGEIHTQLVFTPAPMAEKVDYIIQDGDTLGGIARKHGTTVELVMKGNLLTRANIRPGDRLRVLHGKFRVTVSIRARELTVLLNDRFYKRYRVGTGKYEKTPTGDFQVTDRIAQPIWWRADGKAIPYGDPENVLGTHWLALNARGYGIHGTWQPETIGQAESAGCIRLLNSDIEELFNLLPVGTPVSIQP